MSTDVSKNQLKPITLPGYSRSDFGRALSEQFANINTNFQKIGSGELGKGDDGKSCIYIFYNLNSIFIYPTVEETETGGGNEYNSWWSFNQHIYGSDSTLSVEHRDKYERMKVEVDKDYQEYYRITGRTLAEYVAACAYLLFGSSKVFINDKESTAIPEDFSLTGALYADANPDTAGPVTMETSTGAILTYRAIWLRDWFLATAADKLDIYSTHILNFDPGRISIACSPTTDETWKDLGYYRPISSMAYLHVDPRFRNSLTGNSMTGIGSAEDTSGVCYWEAEGSTGLTGRFKVAHLFPQIYYNGSGYYWKINGNNTNIPVTGAQGEPGHSSQLVVVERVENVIGASPSCPQGDSDLNGGPWLPDTLTDPAVVTVNSYAGSTNHRIELKNTQAADFVGLYADAPGIHPVESTTEDPVAAPKYRVESAGAWLVGTKEWNNLEINHTFRVLGVLGGTRFFGIAEGAKYETGAVAEGKGYRPDDPSFAQYNYGDPNAVGVRDNDAIRKKINELDGVPCIVLPGPAYRTDRTSTTVWFATLKKVPVVAKEGKSQLIVYCGPENQFTSSLDEHSFAGMMQELDAFSFKNTGDNRNRPRGLMVPIGSAHVYSDDKSDIWASHLIYADQGGFESIKDGKGESAYKYGISKLTDAKPVLGEDTNLPQSNDLDFQGKQHQFVEAINKRFLHIGSVNDYRTLNYIPIAEPSKNTFNAAVPGRDREHERLGAANSKGERYDIFGDSGHFGKLVGDKNEIQWFEGSELHVDEPVTITGYRDLEQKRYLLNVEGDVTIGRYRHVNDTSKRSYKVGAGGLIIKSTLSSEVRREIGKEGDGDWDKGVGNLIDGIQIIYPGDFLTATNKENLILTSFSGEKNPAYADGGTHYASDTTYPSLLAQDMIGARVLVATNGIAIRNKTENGSSVNFSVDEEGNIQTNGKEVRSNNEDTLWAFHTVYGGESNKLVFGTRLCHLNIPGSGGKLELGNKYKPDEEWSYSTKVGYVNNSDEAGPTATYINSNFLIQDGALAVTGVSPFFVHLKGELNNQLGNLFKFPRASSIGGILLPNNGEAKFGGYIYNGLVIGAPGETITRGIYDPSHPELPGPKSTNADYINKSYEKPTSNNSTPKYGTTGSGDGSDGDKTYNDYSPASLEFFPEIAVDKDGKVTGIKDREITFTPGLWLNPGVDAMIGGSTVIGKNLLVNQAAMINEQVRARSFRRRRSSVEATKNTKSVSLLFDRGWSSMPAGYFVKNDKDEDNRYKYQSPYTNGDGQSGQNAGDSPIILDLGKEYGDKRLVKFGVAGRVRISDNIEGELDGIEGPTQDYQTCLFGQLPKLTHYEYVRYPKPENDEIYSEFNEVTSVTKKFLKNGWDGELFKHTWYTDVNVGARSYAKTYEDWATLYNEGYLTNPFRVWACSDGLKVSIWIQILLNVQHCSMSFISSGEGTNITQKRSSGYGIRLLNGWAQGGKITQGDLDWFLNNSSYNIIGDKTYYGQTTFAVNFAAKTADGLSDAASSLNSYFYDQQEKAGTFPVKTQKYAPNDENGEYWTIVFDSKGGGLNNLYGYWEKVFHPVQGNSDLFWIGNRVCQPNKNYTITDGETVDKWTWQYKDEQDNLITRSGLPGMLVTTINNGIAWGNPVVCTGFNWNALFGNLHTPEFDVDCVVSGVGVDGQYKFPMGYGCGNNGTKGNVDGPGDDDNGACFRLNTKGQLIIMRSNGIGCLARQKQTLNLHFEYLVNRENKTRSEKKNSD